MLLKLTNTIMYVVTKPEEWSPVRLNMTQMSFMRSLLQVQHVYYCRIIVLYLQPDLACHTAGTIEPQAYLLPDFALYLVVSSMLS